MNSCRLALVILAGCGESLPPSLDLAIEIDPDTLHVRREDPGQTLAERRESRRALVASLRSEAAECPSIAYEPIGVLLHDGPTIERVRAVEPAYAIDASDHPAKLDDTSYYTVTHEGGACMYSWWSSGCFVGSRGVHCGQRDSDAALRALIVDHGLDEEPGRLSPEAWMHLVAVMRGAGRILALPDTPHGTCHTELPAEVEAELEATVELGEGRLLLSIPLDMGASMRGPADWIVQRVAIGGGHVVLSHTELWSREEQEAHIWGAVDDPS
ncbi:MAG: hypothetical protein AAF721_20305 [Myxococcota bacterium]